MNLDNTAREKLTYVIEQYGRLICEDPRRCEALLKDLCNGSHKLEINLILIAQREGTASELLSLSQTIPAEMQYARLSHKLVNEHAITEDAARWAVMSWAAALGVKIPEAPQYSAPQDIQSQTDTKTLMENSIHATPDKNPEPTDPEVPQQNKPSSSKETGCWDGCLAVIGVIIILFIIGGILTVIAPIIPFLIAAVIGYFIIAAIVKAVRKP